MDNSNNINDLLEKLKVSERIRDILLKNGTTEQNLDTICNQIDQILAEILKKIGSSSD